MGCSLCAIQRSDESCKLRQGTCQVNGRSLSVATHDQAVEAFQAAKDPIEIEVLRRSTHKPLEPARGIDNSTQTNITMQYLKHIETMAQLPSSAAPLNTTMLNSFCSPLQCQKARSDSPYPPDFDDGVKKDIESKELELEEVDLTRKTTEDKLGLMLCYNMNDEKTTIYVSKVDPEGIAANDGRIQEGDQIIQINGVAVQSHEVAVALLTQEDRENVTIQVARPERQDVGLLVEHLNSLDDLNLAILEQQNKLKEFDASVMQQSTHEEDEGTTDTATLLSNHHEKDSGVGRTDESTRNDESSEQDILGDDQNSLCDTLPETHKKFSNSQGTFESGDMHISNESFLSVDNGDFIGIPGTACERFRKLLELKCLMNGNSLQGFLEHDATLYGKGIGVDCDDQEIQVLNEELLNIELECLSIIHAHRHQAVEGDPQTKDSCTKHLIEQINDEVHQDIINDKTDNECFSSAYNTGESCWSLHPALESDFLESQTMLIGDKGSSMHRRNSTTACSKQNLSPIQEISPTKSLPGDPDFTNQGKRKQNKRRNPRTSLHHCSYKNTYIPAHAQHYQSYMQLIQQKSAVEYAHSQVSLCKNPESTPTDSRPKMGWKVKVRSDGTRYITRRPIRDQLLKDRALRIREERCSMTTDDDAASELKLGRYWNKKERKQHAAQAKEQQQQRQLMKQCHMENKGIAGTLDNKEPDIIQLSRKKMMKRRNKRIFDNWMTIQELLTHGTKSTDGTRLHNSFLSVTTV